MDIKSVFKAIKHHGKILFKGFTRMMYGALTAGLFAIAIYGFIMIPSEGGYIAVSDFVLATATMIVGFNSMYHQGGGYKRKRGGYEK